MNKKLIALAIAAAIAPAAAMADSGNVTVYGVMDASVEVSDNGNGTAVAGVAPSVNGIRTTKVSSNNSRLGFKGNEDLGNGLSAVWQIESTINADGNTLTSSSTGGTTFGGRNTFVGLSSKTAGTGILGRHDTPYKMSTRAYDLFADGLADSRNLMGTGTVAFDNRLSNVMAYMSPTMSGFNAAVAYVAGAEGNLVSTDKKGDAWSLSGNYANGPLSAALGYERHKFGTTYPASTLGNTATVDKSEKAWKIGVGYTVDALAVNAVYEKVSDDLATGTSNAHKAYSLGAKYSIGSNDLKLAYMKAGDKDGQTATGAKQWALGVDHNMSKRTKVYAQYVKLSNDTNAKYGLSGASSTGAVAANGFDADPSAWSFGMRHSF